MTSRFDEIKDLLNVIPNWLNSLADSELFKREPDSVLLHRGIHGSMHEKFGLLKAQGYSYNPAAYAYQTPDGKSHDIAALKRGPHGSSELNPNAPTYIFFHGKGGSSLASIQGLKDDNQDSGTIRPYRSELIKAFPPGANVIAIEIDYRNGNPGIENFARQYQAIATNLANSGITKNIHLYGESMGSAHAAYAANHFHDKKLNVISTTLITPPDQLIPTSVEFGAKNPGTTRVGQFLHRLSQGLHRLPDELSHPASIAASGGADNNLNTIGALGSLRAVNPDMILHIVTTHEYDMSKPGHVVSNNRQASVGVAAVNMGFKVIKSHQDTDHFAPDGHMAVNTTQRGLLANGTPPEHIYGQPAPDHSRSGAQSLPPGIKAKEPQRH